MSSTRPWRSVEYIDARVGARGGKYWSLRLSCGHHKAVRRPVFRPASDLMRVRHKGTKSVVRKFTAPERVRCLLCEA